MECFIEGYCIKRWKEGSAAVFKTSKLVIEEEAGKMSCP